MNGPFMVCGARGRCIVRCRMSKNRSVSPLGAVVVADEPQTVSYLIGPIEHHFFLTQFPKETLKIFRMNSKTCSLFV